AASRKKNDFKRRIPSQKILVHPRHPPTGDNHFHLFPHLRGERRLRLPALRRRHETERFLQSLHDRLAENEFANPRLNQKQRGVKTHLRRIHGERRRPRFRLRLRPPWAPPRAGETAVTRAVYFNVSRAALRHLSPPLGPHE